MDAQDIAFLNNCFVLLTDFLLNRHSLQSCDIHTLSSVQFQETCLMRIRHAAICNTDISISGYGQENLLFVSNFF